MIDPIRVPHAYLAVDLFFLLSGFVIDHAYGRKLAGGMTAGQFILARYVRLYPLYLIGLTIGAAGAAISLVMGQGVLTGGAFLTALGAGLLMLPSPTMAYDVTIAPFDYPAWSLLFELAVNIVFALTFRWWRLPVLLVVAAAAAVGLCWVGYAYGSIDFGPNWILTWVGFLRVTFSFALGVAIHRLYGGTHRRTVLACLLPLLAILLFLGIGGIAGDLLIVLVVFPAFVWVAVHFEPPAEHAGERLFVLLGTLSYPLYVIHLPTIQFIERALTVLHIERMSLAPWAGLLIGLALAVTAILLDRWYDAPVRRWLTKRLGLQGRQAVPRIDRGL